jgi:uncharacterized membrane protein
MITDVITGVFSVASAVATGLATLIGELIELIYDSGLTDFGTLVVLVAAIPLAWNLLTYFVGLFRRAAKVK